MSAGVSPLLVHHHTEALAYTGIELRPHFLLQRFGLAGNAVAAFRGSCNVLTEHLVDWEDKLASDCIRAESMIHVIGEFFGVPLREGVWLQRMAMACAFEELIVRGVAVTRTGDDLFVRERKLSVSIVTASPVSCLLHIGINIDPAGAPVPAIGLAELGVAPVDFAHAWLGRFQSEWDGVAWAAVKVRPV